MDSFKEELEKGKHASALAFMIGWLSSSLEGDAEEVKADVKIFIAAYDEVTKKD